MIKSGTVNPSIAAPNLVSESNEFSHWTSMGGRFERVDISDKFPWRRHSIAVAVPYPTACGVGLDLHPRVNTTDHMFRSGLAAVGASYMFANGQNAGLEHINV
jgi:hypothetical protein